MKIMQFSLIPPEHRMEVGKRLRVKASLARQVGRHVRRSEAVAVVYDRAAIRWGVGS
jgi:hypothetical protein